MELKKNTYSMKKDTADSISLENKLKELLGDIKSNISRIVGLDTGVDDSVKKIDEVLSKIPSIRKLSAQLKLEKAVEKHDQRLKASGVNMDVFDFVTKKRRDIISKRPYVLGLEKIENIEKKLKISDEFMYNESDIFGNFRLLLSKSKDIDEIEVILRKVRMKIEEETQIKTQIKRENTVNYFIREAGFEPEEKKAVAELLMHESLSSALKDDIVTRKLLSGEITKIHDDFKEASRKIMNKMNTEMDKIDEVISKEAPFPVRVFSNYIVNPLSGSFGLLGILVIILYSIGRYAVIPLENILPDLSSLVKMTELPDLCRIFSPRTAYITGFGAIITGGLIKMADEKIKKLLSKKKNRKK